MVKEIDQTSLLSMSLEDIQKELELDKFKSVDDSGEKSVAQSTNSKVAKNPFDVADSVEPTKTKVAKNPFDVVESVEPTKTKVTKNSTKAKVAKNPFDVADIEESTNTTSKSNNKQINKDDDPFADFDSPKVKIKNDPLDISQTEVDAILFDTSDDFGGYITETHNPSTREMKTEDYIVDINILDSTKEEDNEVEVINPFTEKKEQLTNKSIDDLFGDIIKEKIQNDEQPEKEQIVKSKEVKQDVIIEKQKENKEPVMLNELSILTEEDIKSIRSAIRNVVETEIRLAIKESFAKISSEILGK